MEDLVVKFVSEWVDVVWQDGAFFVLYKLSQLDFWTNLRYAFSGHKEEKQDATIRR